MAVVMMCRCEVCGVSGFCGFWRDDQNNRADCCADGNHYGNQQAYGDVYNLKSGLGFGCWQMICLMRLNQ
jgi:hypothetical protein